jgi:hypothetical protein
MRFEVIGSPHLRFLWGLMDLNTKLMIILNEGSLTQSYSLGITGTKW